MKVDPNHFGANEKKIKKNRKRLQERERIIYNAHVRTDNDI